MNWVAYSVVKKVRPFQKAIGEVVRAGQIFDFFAGVVLRSGGETIPSVRPGVSVEITREPVGVVGIITPWNFPIAIPAWKIAPALAVAVTLSFEPSLGDQASVTAACVLAAVSIVLGALLCVPAGRLADRIGKARVASFCMIASALAAFGTAASFGGAPWITVIFVLIWGGFHNTRFRAVFRAGRRCNPT